MQAPEDTDSAMQIWCTLRQTVEKLKQFWASKIEGKVKLKRHWYFKKLMCQFFGNFYLDGIWASHTELYPIIA